jgi:hypothetical protein
MWIDAPNLWILSSSPQICAICIFNTLNTYATVHEYKLTCKLSAWSSAKLTVRSVLSPWKQKTRPKKASKQELTPEIAIAQDRIPISWKIHD